MGTIRSKVLKRLAIFDLALLVVVVLWASGCPTVQSDAYKTVVAAKAFLDDQKSKHPECATGAASQTCTYLKQATAAKDALIDAGEIYCGGPQFASGGACQAPTSGTPGAAQAQAKLQQAISNYKVTEADLKAAVGK